MDRQDGVAGIMLPGEHHLQLPIVERRLQAVHRLLEVQEDILPFARELRADLRLLELLLEPPE